MSEFKVGDRVVVGVSTLPHRVGEVGVVNGIDKAPYGSTWPYYVKFDDKAGAWCGELRRPGEASDAKLTPEFSRFAQALMLESDMTAEQAYTAALYLQERST